MTRSSDCAEWTLETQSKALRKPHAYSSRSSFVAPDVETAGARGFDESEADSSVTVRR
jgi:hypothetical protein